MGAFIQEMGVMRYPLFLAALFLFIQIGYAAWALRVPSVGRGDAMKLHAVLVWGGLCALLGVLGTVVGLSVAAGAISRAAAVSPAVIWGGVKVALSTTVVGLVLLTVAVLAWLALGWARSRASAEG